MTYPHVYLVCKDCMIKAYLYEIIKGKITLKELMKTIEGFRDHAGHNISIVDSNNFWFETNYEKLKDVK